MQRFIFKLEGGLKNDDAAAFLHGAGRQRPRDANRHGNRFKG
jgi:hypothetical protein